MAVRILGKINRETQK